MFAAPRMTGEPSGLLFPFEQVVPLVASGWTTVPPGFAAKSA
jgi:hypothetical protein